jgi:hypothetical protein
MDVQRWSAEEQVETRVRSQSARLVSERVAHIVGAFFDALPSQPKETSRWVFVPETPRFDVGRFGKRDSEARSQMHRELQPMLDLAFAESTWTLRIQMPNPGKPRRSMLFLGCFGGKSSGDCQNHEFYAIIHARRRTLL